MEKNLQPVSGDNESSFPRIAEAANGLIYISETDAEVVPFETGEVSDLTVAEILKLSGSTDDKPVEIISPEAFFEPLVKMRAWYGEREKERATGYAKLFTVLKQELSGLKVFRIGSIQIAIYVVGIDREGKVTGVTTHAVET